MSEFAGPGQQPTDSPRPRWRKRAEALPPTQPGPWRSSAAREVQVRIVWDNRTGEIEGIRVRRWDPDRRTYASVRPTEQLAADVRQAFAHFLAEDIVADIWHVPSTGMCPPVRNAEVLTVAEELLDPRLLAAELVRVTAQVAAVHAGIPPPVARVMGQAAGDLFVQLLGKDSNARKVRAVQYADLTLSAEDGSILSPPLAQIADAATADVIDKLLTPDDLPPGRKPPPVRPAHRTPAVAPDSPHPDPDPSHSEPLHPEPDPEPSRPAPGLSKPNSTENDHQKPQPAFEP